jgi:pyruvate kinase
MQDIYNCKKIGVDSLCISNVRRAEEVKVFKNNLEKKNGMSIIAKI